MKKQSNQEIANKAFKEDESVDKVFVCGGFPFVTENAAQLHGNTSKKKKKVYPFFRKEDVSQTKTDQDIEPIKLDRLNKVDLIKVAESKGIRSEESATKAEIIKMIEDVDNIKLTE